jgi:hypothetical protein
LLPRSVISSGDGWLEETFAGSLIMPLVLIPLFAFRVLSKTLGEGR